MVAFYLSDQILFKYNWLEGGHYTFAVILTKAMEMHGKNDLHVEPSGFIFYVQQ